MRGRNTFGNGGSSQRDSAFKVLLFGALGFLVLSISALLILIFSSPDASGSAGGLVIVEKQAFIETVDVLVPVTEILGGVALQPAMFKAEARPRIGLSERAVTDLEEIRGRYAATMILPGQPLYRDYITDIRPINQITAKIPSGYRAVTIHVDVKTSIEGWAKAGAKVDVVWNTTIRNKRAVQIIVENALVISAARQTDSQQQPGAEIPNELTLLVTNEDAKKVLLASNTGTLSLSLRGDRDAGKSEAGMAITEDDLLGSSNRDPKSTRPRSIVKVRDDNGNLAEFVLQNGELEPYLDR